MVSDFILKGISVKWNMNVIKEKKIANGTILTIKYILPLKMLKWFHWLQILLIDYSLSLTVHGVEGGKNEVKIFLSNVLWVSSTNLFF